MSKTRLNIIIVTFNSEKFIENCLDSIVNNQKDISQKITIIDNGSSDKTIDLLDKLKEKYGLKIIKLKSNLGFARAVNMGIKKPYSDFYLLLNPDIVLLPDTIKKLISTSKKLNAGIVGGVTKDFNGRHSDSYYRIPNLFVGLFDFTNLRKIYPKDKWHKYFYYRDKKINTSEYVDGVTGGLMLISKPTITKLGLLDERYFMYLEDVDYCLSAKKRNILVALSTNSIAYHYGGGSSKNKDKIRHSSWMISRKKFFWKNYDLITNLILQPIFLIDDIYITLRMVNKK